MLYQLSYLAAAGKGSGARPSGSPSGYPAAAEPGRGGGPVRATLAGMRRRRRTVLVSVAAVVAAGVAVALLLRGGEQDEAGADLVAQALSRLPPDAAAVALVATDPGAGQVRALGRLLDRIPGSAIALSSLGDLGTLAGAPVAVAVTRPLDGFVAAWVAEDEEAARRVVAAIPPGSGAGPLRLAAIEREGTTVVAGSDARLVREALARDGSGRAATSRLDALPDDALVRAAGDGRTLRGWSGVESLRRLAPELADGARELTLTVEAGDDALTARVGAALAPGTPLPLATGAGSAAPAAFDVPVTAALRDPRPAFEPLLRAVGATEDYARANALLRRLRRDDLDSVLRDQLTGTATLAMQPGGVAVQLQLRDAGPLGDLLDDVARIPDLLLGPSGIDVDEADGVFTVRLPDTPEVRVAVEGDRVGVVAAGDPRPVATRGPVARTTPGAGALAIRLEAEALQAQLIERFGLPGIAAFALRSLGDLTAGATASRDRLDVVLTLPIRG